MTRTIKTFILLCLLLLGAIGGAGADTFTPNSITGCTLWLSPSAGLYSDTGKTTPTVNGGAVAVWADQSGNGNDAVQATAASQPVLNTAYQGATGLDFASGGTAHFLKLATNFGETTSFSVFVVIRMNGTTGVDSQHYMNVLTRGTYPLGGSFSAHSLVINPSAASVSATASTGASGSSSATSGVSMPLGQDYLLEQVWDGANVSLYVNGQITNSQSLAAGTLGASSDGAVAIGGGTNSGFTNVFQGAIREVVGYKSIITPSSRQTLEAYYARKYSLWGLTQQPVKLGEASGNNVSATAGAGVGSISGALPAGSTGCTTETSYTLLRNIKNPRLIFLATTGYDGGTTTPVTWKASVYWQDGSSNNSAFYPVSFHGVTTAMTPPGGSVLSDPLPLTFFKGQHIYVRVFASGTGTSPQLPGTMSIITTVDTTGADLTAGGAFSSTGATAGGLYPAPNVLLGDIPSSVLNASLSGLVVGDSIARGQGDNGVGLFEYGLTNVGIPYINIGNAGEAMTAAFLTNHTNRLPITQYGDFYIDELGINDIIYGGYTLSAMEANYQSSWAVIAANGKPVYQTTIPPCDSISGNSSQFALYQGINAWIRSKPSPLKGVIDIAAAMETFPGSGIRKSIYASDPIHPNTAGHQAMGAVVAAYNFAADLTPSTSTVSFTSGQLRRGR